MELDSLSAKMLERFRLLQDRDFVAALEQRESEIFVWEITEADRKECKWDFSSWMKAFPCLSDKVIHYTPLTDAEVEELARLVALTGFHLAYSILKDMWRADRVINHSEDQ